MRTYDDKRQKVKKETVKIQGDLPSVEGSPRSCTPGRIEGQIAMRASIGNVMVLLLWILTISQTGCSGIPVRSRDGTTHHVIIGIGVVSVNNSRPSAATVTSTHAVGVAMSDTPILNLGIGYSSSLTTAIPDDAEDVRVETSRLPFGPIIVDVQKAKLRNGQTNNKDKE